MIIRTCICIPTYNNPESIAKVVSDCLEQTPFPVWIIDDGSYPPVEEVLTRSESQLAQGENRLRIIRIPENRGKGIAIQTAIHACVQGGFTHLLTIDGDGQHLVSEIPKLIEITKQHPWDLVIGNRKLAGATIPGATHFGRRFSNFWVGFETGTEIKDSQSGFRLYPLFHVQNMRFFTKRYDFEIEVLIRLMWKGVQVREVEIEVYYPPKSERVSHFHKFWDNARVSTLNTVLVTVSLLRSNRSPGKLAVALGMGVLIGCTPFYGIQTFIVAAVAFVFRLNFVLLLLGSQISIPPLAPFLAIASIRIGQLMYPNGSGPIKDLSQVTAHYSQWVVGSLLLGSALGFATGLTSYVVSKRMQSKITSPKRNWTGRTGGGALGNGILKFIAKYLGLKGVYFCLYFIIPYYYLFGTQARRSGQEYGSICRPELNPLLRQGFILKQLLVFGKVLADRMFHGLSRTCPFEINSSGLENILSSIRSERGFILVGAHIGGWDMAASLLKNTPFSGELHILQHEAAGLTMNKVAGSRGRDHIRFLASHATNPSMQTILSIRQVLNEGKPIALLGDRPMSNQYELVLLCEKLAPLDTTAFRIGMACNAPLLFTFGFKGKGKFYDFYASPAKLYACQRHENKSLKLLEWTQEYAKVIEGYLKTYPEQWFNFFPLWSAVPTLPEGRANPAPRNYLIEELRKQNTEKAESELATKATASPVSQP